MNAMTKPNAAELATMTERELAEDEAVIREGSLAYQQVGHALLRIRTGHGYRLRGFKTFEAYCQAAFGITDRHGRRLIAATETSEKIAQAVGVAPASEGVARELIGVANDPIVLKKIQAKLEKRKSGINKASAELVAEIKADVTGKARPPKVDKPKNTPKPNGQPAASAVGAEDATTLSAILTSVRAFLCNHPWLKNDPDTVKPILAQVDRGLGIAGGLLAAAYAGAGGAPAPKPGEKIKPAPPTGPACPNCKKPIAGGDVFCGACGAAL